MRSSRQATPVDSGIVSRRKAAHQAIKWSATWRHDHTAQYFFLASFRFEARGLYPIARCPWDGDLPNSRPTTPGL